MRGDEEWRGEERREPQRGDEIEERRGEEKSGKEGRNEERK